MYIISLGLTPAYDSIKSGDGELVGSKNNLCDTEMVDICSGCIQIILGHPRTHVTNLTAKYLDLSIMLHDKKCLSCIRGKQRLKNVTNKVKLKIKNPGELLFFDASIIQYKNLGGSKFWLLY